MPHNGPTDDLQTGLASAVDRGLLSAAGTTSVEEQEINEVKALVEEYDEARKFDEDIRKKYNLDRCYARGEYTEDWASDANIIGAYIDILISFLYAQNPDVSVRPAQRVRAPAPEPAPTLGPAAPLGGALPGAPAPVGLPSAPVAPLGAPPAPTQSAAPVVPQEEKDARAFADTLQIVIPRLWRDAKLKLKMKRTVRSALSVGPGWIKAFIYSETRTNAEAEKELKDARDNLEEIESLKRALIESPEGYDSSYEEKITALNNQIKGVEGNVEVIVKRGLCVDFLRAEDVQVSLDVSSLEDYLDANWISHDLYISKRELIKRFPRLTEEECAAAATYTQRVASEKPAADSPDGQFVKGDSGAATSFGGDSKRARFVKVVEVWDHRDNLIKTFIDGVKRWAKEPYTPPQAASRFYSFFSLAFFWSDGLRHPQSLTWRLRKLQDEYSHTRSNGRLTRERSVPATLFNAGQLTEQEVSNIVDAEHMEFVPMKPSAPDADLSKMFAAKPVPSVDPAMFDTTPILRDMNIMSGVAEAQANSASTTKTATEAEIQQAGFASRTGADRDAEEDFLSDLAQYTAECAIQSLPTPYVQRMAGPFAFWPEGMAVEDVLTMLDVEISAGTTGKPKARADKEAWATLMPIVQAMGEKIVAMEAGAGPNPLTQFYRELLNETVKRLDDRLSIERLLPDTVPLSPLPLALPGPADGAAPVGNGNVNKPPAPPA